MSDNVFTILFTDPRGVVAALSNRSAPDFYAFSYGHHAHRLNVALYVMRSEQRWPLWP
jgi:hypothetical protein